jgi:23S rRNA (cytosine1962-C5)-methyltransferase
MSYPIITLLPHKERSIERMHPWIFSGAAKSMPENLIEGEVVSVVSSKGNPLATGHYQNGSIIVRVLSFDDAQIDQSFFNERLSNAFELRQKLNLTDNSETNIYRLVHAEGDGLPGLVIDVFDNHAVVQCHSIGMHKSVEFIVNALQHCYGDKLKSIYDKSSETLPKDYAQQTQNKYLYKRNDVNEGVIVAKEYGNSFEIDWVNGQKTGFFIDQRENRKLLAEFSKGKKILNTFCYSGGFSVYALNAGASVVHSLDSSKKAIELVENNLKLNTNFIGEHKCIVADAVQYIKQLPEEYDVIILDPPAFAKHKSARHNAIQGYKRLNERAIKQIKPGGIIFTFSCSQIVTKDMFFSTVMAASIDAKRNVRVLHQLHQPADHPVNIYHPESEYLKGLVIQVD